jgi:hypothetical protein
MIVFDFIRAIILFKNAATYYFEQVKKIGVDNSLFGLLLAVYSFSFLIFKVLNRFIFLASKQRIFKLS